jgi:NAD(P)-dependent dehydrogenase (short-subunit alcohol dehydrogenase family)
MDLGLSGRACVVTGASRGIGLETARICSERASYLAGGAWSVDAGAVKVII